MSSRDQKLWTYYRKENPSVFSMTHNRHNRVFSNVKKYLKRSGLKILEVGFGDGYLLGKLSKKYKCYGADISEEIIKKTSAEIENVNFTRIGTDGVMPFESNFFDGFIASEVLEHMDNEELSVCIKEIERILKRGGYAFITFPAEEKLEENEFFCPNCSTNFHRWGHKQSWSIKKAEDVFKDLEIVKISDYFVRHEGINPIENFIGYVLYIFRNLVNKFNKLPNRSYLVVLRKK